MTINLRCYEPEHNHDKVYIIHTRRMGSSVVVVARWGRRGSFLQEQTKLVTSSASEAMNFATALAWRKRSKGYEKVF